MVVKGKLEGKRTRGIIIGVVTSYWQIKYANIAPSNDFLCRFCSQIDEITDHIICQSEMRYSARDFQF